METKKIKAGVEYATCDGNLVVFDDPVQRGWYWEYGVKNGERQNILKFAEQVDPWGGCMDAKKPVQTGLKCLQYEADIDGKRIEGTGVVTVVMPKDVKGTWKDFLVLHAEKHRRRVLERDANRAQRHFQEELAKVKLPGNENSRVDVEWHYGWRVKGHEPLDGKIRRMFMVVDCDTVEELTVAAFQLGVEIPKPIIEYLDANYMTKKQFDKLRGKS